MFNKERMQGLNAHCKLAILISVCILLIANINLRGQIFKNLGMIPLIQVLSAWPAENDFQKAVMAERFLRSSLTLQSDPATRGNLGDAFLLQGHREDAIKLWELVPGQERLLLQRGINTYGQDHYSEALLWLELTLQVDARLSLAWYYEGLVYRALAQPEEALAAFRMAERQPDSDVIISDIYFNLGQLLASDDLEAALDLYDAALSANSFLEAWRRRQVYYAKGEVLLHQGRHAEAMQAFDAVLDLYPDHYWAYIRLAQASWRANGDVVEVKRYLQRAMTINPDIKWSYRHLGDIYQEAGYLEEAKTAYQQVLKIDPRDEVALEFVSR